MGAYPSSDRGSNSASDRSSPGPGELIDLEWGDGQVSRHQFDRNNRLLTLAKQAGNWVWLHDEKIATLIAGLGSPLMQAIGGQTSSLGTVSAGVAMAGAPAAYVFTKHMVNAVRGKNHDVYSAAFGAVTAAGAFAWGLGTGGVGGDKARDYGAMIHGVGVPALAARSMNWASPPPQQRTELPMYNLPNTNIASAASVHRSSGSSYPPPTPYAPPMQLGPYPPGPSTQPTSYAPPAQYAPNSAYAPSAMSYGGPANYGPSAGPYPPPPAPFGPSARPYAPPPAPFGPSAGPYAPPPAPSGPPVGSQGRVNPYSSGAEIRGPAPLPQRRQSTYGQSNLPAPPAERQQRGGRSAGGGGRK
ncbi:hypothetical protein QQG74_03575 [Micromonospora sp. FIMYZ51]|uniref:hypothetical protein n=1 Tax=Micromonospora sp. FIMYZ51 TaxID=3051832 RepID=UPI00311ECB78